MKKKKKQLHKLFSAIMAFAMVFTLLAPMNALAADDAKPVQQNGISEGNIQAQAAIAEQLAILAGPAVLHEDLLGLSGEQEVDVIVHLSEKPVALEKGIKELAGQKFTSAEGTSVEKKVNVQQSQVKKTMKVKNIKFKEGYSFDTVLNGFAATVKADDLGKLLEIDGVVLVEPDELRYAVGNPSNIDGQVDAAMSTSIPFLEIENLWENGIQGHEIKVGVLDTGIDYTHPEFEGVYKGGKNYVSHGSTYARTRAENDPYETSPLDRKSTTPEFDSQGNSFYTSHGTHVAGTIAAIGANEYNIKGIAPKVELYAYRVLGAYGSGATAGIIKAIDDSVKDKMDVINLSLGGSSNSSTASDAIAINNAMLGGTVAVVATGNSGPNRGTIGNPSTAALGIAVGNSTNPESMYEASVSVKAGSYNNTSTIKLMGVKFGKNVAEALKGEFDVVAIPSVGNPKDFTGIDVNGKVALISRGDIAFVDKIANAKAAGAKAVLIHNSATGTNTPGPADVFLGDSFGFIPAFDMSYTEGKALRDSLGSGTGKVSFSNVRSTKTTGDEMNSSSSRGPANPDFDIKPDVVAPGTNIMSSVPAYGKDFPDADYSESYDRYTGTSMATPHIAGIAALILQANPTWTPFDVKVTLSNTAKVLDKKFDVFAQGPGRVRPYEAAYPTILAYALGKTTFSGKEVDNEKGTVTFGKQGQVRDGNVTVKKQIRVEDVSGKGGDYSVRVETLKTFGDAKVTVNKSTFTLDGTEILDLTLTASKATPKSGDEILGYIYISGNSSEISLPFAADFSPLVLPTGVHYVELSGHDVSFNEDGVKDSTSLSFQLVGNYGNNYIGLHDLLSEDFEEDMGYIGYASTRRAGTYTLPIISTFTDWDNQEAGLVPIPEGVYLTAFYAQLSTGSRAWYGDLDFEPLFVVNSPATVGTAESHHTVGPNYTFNGTIVDKYIDFQEPLDEIEYGFDLYKKLFVTYDLTNANGDKVDEGSVNFALDGAFSLNLSKLTVGNNTLTIYVDDAAGNKAEYEYTIVAEVKFGLSVSPEKLALKVGDTEQLEVTVTEEFEGGKVESTDKGTGTVEEVIVTDTNDIGSIVAGTEIEIELGDSGTVEEETETESDNSGTVEEGTELEADDNGTIEERTDGDEVEVVDVIADADYSSDNEDVVIVSDTGLVTTVGTGTATITVSYEGMEATVAVEVAPIVTISVDNSNLSIERGKTGSVRVTETTKTSIEGEPTVTNVTDNAQYSVANNSMVTVDKGVITANATGTTTITITHGKNTVTVTVTVTDPAPNPGSGGGGGNSGGGGGYFPSTPTTPTTPTKPDPVKPDPVKPEPVKPVIFTDVTDHWAELYIQKAVQLGLFKGYEDGTFKPNNQLTRAQAVSLIVRALGLETDEAAPFNDIGKYAEETQAEIAAAYKYGIVKGNNGSFKPAEKVTRAQIALMISRAYEYKIGETYTPTAIAPFSDYGNYNEETVSAISMLYELKIITGFEGKFMPQDPTTRAQAAKMFVNIMELLQ
ncbi:S8 family serine peptidase [Sporosarcina oncorhynchi]|uniref:S8 family serine peptidase n=1 Tax=Sporosarcina oncorhynchi TaxID=3056444 RepID=A0ABZ0L657_9BACL|nr:S8 family serine peptidase [Sporosarcina sp. T2O-4]WOV88057.1 S8 family serine peptidase [Sporosarcina sp. T2O-4]